MGAQVISLHLERLSELFEPPGTDLFGRDRANYYLAGLDSAIIQLRGRPDSRRPVRLEITVPAAEVTPGVEHMVARAVGRYCELRIQSNHFEKRAARWDGLASLKVGLPVAAVGVILVAVFRTGILADVIGAVLTWVGLWYPLDQLLFYPAEFTRENRPLRRLRNAEVALFPRGPAEPGDTTASAAQA